MVAAAVFTALRLGDSMSDYCIKYFNYGISAAADYYSVITRIKELLTLQEKEPLLN